MFTDNAGFLAAGAADALRATLLSGGANSYAPVRAFRISAAMSASQQLQARELVGRKYAARGYAIAAKAAQALGVREQAAEADLLTLTAARESAVLGTLSVRFDGAQGLAADQVFPTEMRQLRAGGRRLCEFTQLAMDIEAASKQVLACLFHMAYLQAHHLRGAELLVVEVNPRHVGYYRRMLGFRVCSEERMNPRVQAPAVLMCLDFKWGGEQVQRYGGQPHMASVVRSLYPFFYSQAEEATLLQELRAARQ